jgi:hypothetical protein
MSMKRRASSLASSIGQIALLTWTLASVPCTVAAGEVIDRVLAVAGGNLILLSDVSAAREFGIVTPVAEGDPVREVLSRLIERALVLAEVDRYSPAEPAAVAVDQSLEVVRARFIDAESFGAALARSGIHETHLREMLRSELRIRAYLDQRFTVPIPTDDDLDAFYRNHSAQFTRGGQLMPFAEVRQEVLDASTSERRRTLVTDWIADLRRRADVLDLYSK